MYIKTAGDKDTSFKVTSGQDGSLVDILGVGVAGLEAA
jgi:hypothetical protein